MPALRDYKIFISHAWDYNDDYYRMVKLLNEANHFEWTNLSVPEHDPILNTGDKLAAALNTQMRNANIFLILSGMYVAHSDWIEYEVNFARRVGRPIIGIQPWGSTTVPLIVQNGAKEIVGWSTSSVVDAVRRWALEDGR